MYCVNCGVKLEDTETKCPLCETVVYHPDLRQGEGTPLYPAGRIPKPRARSKVLAGLSVPAFLIPLLVCFLCDRSVDGVLEWFGFVAGGLAVAYVALALPLWFKRSHPIVFTPCGVAAALVYLLYVSLATGGDWFLPFAFPVAGGFGILLCALVVLLCLLKRGRLFIWGGYFIALGGWMLLLEFLLGATFGMPFYGWSVYPLVVFVLLGGALIFLGISATAREIMERKLFF